MLSSCFERSFECVNAPGDELTVTVTLGHLFIGTLTRAEGERDVQLSKDQVRELIDTLTEAVNERMIDEVEPIECN